MTQPAMIATRRTRAPNRARGFTLIELMVAITIGLVFTLVITGTVLTMGRQFRIVGSNVAAQGTAQIALSLIDSAGRSAGAGLFNNGQMLCPSLNAWKNGTVKSQNAVFMPVKITDGGSNTASDTIVFTAAAATGPLSAAPVVVTSATDAGTVVVSNAGGFQNGDLALLGAPGSGQPCLLFQVTAAAADGAVCGGNATLCTTLTRATAGTGYNAPAGTFTAAAPSYGFATDTGAVPAVYGPAVVNRLGSDFVQTAFAVPAGCEMLIQYNAFSDVPTCSRDPLTLGGGANALATDVVLMHAQYGISALPASDIVTSWVEPSGATWAAPTAANVALIKAVRVVVVVRSKEAEATNVTAACTNANAVVNTGPCSFQDAAAPVIDLSAVSVAAGKTWRNYRYRVHQAVVPLRNVIWSN